MTDPRADAVEAVIQELAGMVPDADYAALLERYGIEGEPAEEEEDLLSGLLLDELLWPLAGASPLARFAAEIATRRPELASALAAYQQSSCDIYRFATVAGRLVGRSCTGGKPVAFDLPLAEEGDPEMAVLMRVIHHDGFTMGIAIAPLISDFRELPEELRAELKHGAKSFPKAIAALRSMLVFTYRMLEQVDGNEDDAALETIARGLLPEPDADADAGADDPAPPKPRRR